jgi:hypothetical protein
MKTINNENGCSVCAQVSENYTMFTHRGKKYYQYDYRTQGGRLFSCVKPTLAKCRKERDNWMHSL